MGDTIDGDMKKCGRCRRTKLLSEYYGHRRYCKSCDREASRKSREKKKQETIQIIYNMVRQGTLNI